MEISIVMQQTSGKKKNQTGCADYILPNAVMGEQYPCLSMKEDPNHLPCSVHVF